MADNINPKYVLPWDSPTDLAKHEENIRFLRRAFDHEETTGAYPTILIAATNSKQSSQDAADYVCNGSNDVAQIQSAIADCVALGGGRVNFAEGDYALGSGVAVTLSGTTVELHSFGGAAFTGSAGGNAFTMANGVTGRLILSGLTITTDQDTISTQDAQLYVHGCFITSTSGNGIVNGDGAAGGQGNSHFIYNNEIVAADRAVRIGASFRDYICNNRIRVTGTTGRGISLANSGSGSVGPFTVIGNYIVGPGTSGTSRGISSSWFFFDNMVDSMIAENHVVGFNTGIWQQGGQRIVVGWNTVRDCALGIQMGGGNTSDQDNACGWNEVVNCTSGIKVSAGVSGTDATVIGWNNVPSGGITVDSGVTNTHLVYNYGTVADSGTGTSILRGVAARKNSSGSTFARGRLNLIEGNHIALTVADDSTDDEIDVTVALDGNVLDNNARVGVRKNTGVTTYLRRRLNLIEGTGISLTVADDSGDEEVDVTIGATGAGATVEVAKNTATLVGTEPRINFIEGAGITLTMTDHAASRVDVQIDAATGTAGPGELTFQQRQFK